VDEEGAKGTPLYMAPEVMLGDEFNEKADVYSFGIVLWESLTRLEPFSHHSDFDAFVEAVCINHERPPLPADCLPSLKNLITKCWAANPAVRPSFPEIVDSLEHIIIECGIEDDFARNLWKTNFFRKEQVLWLEEFVPVFAPATGTSLTTSKPNALQKEIDLLVKTLQYKCLHAVLAEKKDGEYFINLEKFGQVVGWFGPFKGPDGKIKLLDTIQSVLSYGWFHGPIDSEEASHKLKEKEPYTFLIRFSGRDHPNCFAISKVNAKSKIIHQRVVKKASSQEVTVGETTWPSLIDLVEKGAESLKLVIPCPECPYAHLFSSQPNKESSIYDDPADADDDE